MSDEDETARPSSAEESAPAPIVIECTYSKALLIAAWRALWWSTTGPFTAATAMVLTGTLVALIVGGARSGFLGIAAGALGMMFVWIGIATLSVHRRILAKLDKLPTRQVRFELLPDALAWQTADGSATLKWPVFEGVREFPEFWILSTAGGSEVVIPAATLGENAKGLIRSKVPRYAR